MVQRTQLKIEPIQNVVFKSHSRGFNEMQTKLNLYRMLYLNLIQEDLTKCKQN